jgi:predicted membrane metal-binding protein
MLTKSQKLVYVFGAWMLAVLAVLVLLNSLIFEYFFVFSFIGFLIIVELGGPLTVRPVWTSRINIVTAIGVMAFAVIVLNNVLTILGINLLK